MKIVGTPRGIGIGRPKGAISVSGKITPVLDTVANAQGKRTKRQTRLSQTTKPHKRP